MEPRHRYPRYIGRRMDVLHERSRSRGYLYDRRRHLDSMCGRQLYLRIHNVLFQFSRLDGMDGASSHRNHRAGLDFPFQPYRGWYHRLAVDRYLADMLRCLPYGHGLQSPASG